MKKIVSLILIMILSITLTACGDGVSQKPTTPTTPPGNENVVTPIQPGGDFDAGDDYGEENPSNGNVVTPIQPGGDYNVGGNYGN